MPCPPQPAHLPTPLPPHPACVCVQKGCRVQSMPPAHKNGITAPPASPPRQTKQENASPSGQRDRVVVDFLCACPFLNAQSFREAPFQEVGHH